MYRAEIYRNGELVAKLERPRPFGPEDAAAYSGDVLHAAGKEYPGPAKPEIDHQEGPVPRTQALRPEEIAAARGAVAQATEQAQRSTSAVLRDAVVLLAATFDGVLSKLGGHDDVLKEDR